jgi:hypothetical protein
MTVEFRNANSFRNYPFRRFDDSGGVTVPLKFLSDTIVDAQFDIFCDRVRDKLETPPLVSIAGLSYQLDGDDSYSLTLEVSVGFGLRDANDNPLRGEHTPRKQYNVPPVQLTTGSTGSEDSKYTYLWVSDSSPDFDKQDPDIYTGSDIHVTGYIVLDTEVLRNPPTPTIQETWMYSDGLDEHGNALLAFKEDAPILEDGVVTFLGNQLVRKLHIANLDPISATGATVETRDVSVVLDEDFNAEVFQGEVSLEEGFNCRIDVDPQTDTVTIIPALGAGQGNPCNESDPSEGEEACSDFIYSINGVRSSNGAIQFSGVAPLQIFQGDPTFTAEDPTPDYTEGLSFPAENLISTENFWTHSLIFRIGNWGENGDLPCPLPCSP